jgi:serine/threonine protein kinase
MNYITPEMASDHNSMAAPPMDVWTIGIMLYLMMFGVFPFKDDQNGSLEEHVVKCNVKIPKDATVSPQCVDFMRCCLVKEPECRISPSAMLIHDWFLMTDDELEELAENKIPFD